MASTGTRAGQKAGQRMADHCIVVGGSLTDLQAVRRGVARVP